MNHEINVLDCTFRDGGYYNNWNFSPEIVRAYLANIAAAGVHCIELGTRIFPQDRFLGAFAYSSDEYIKTLQIPPDVQLAVMVDAKTFLSRNQPISDGVKALFSPKSESPVHIVRLAVHFSEIPQSRNIADTLRALGYAVVVNLMQSAGKPDETLQGAAAEISRWGNVSTLYFADSLGNMDRQEVARIVSALRKHWSGDLGIHTHNNQGNAIENSLAAIDLGVKWIDSTILGMGRGAGNAATEILLLELQKRLQSNVDPERLYSLVLKYFEPLQRHHRWGPSLLYYLAAAKNIHPTYIQVMLSDSRYSHDEILDAIRFMGSRNTSSFNPKVLNEAESVQEGSVEGTWVATGWCKDKEAVLIGAGESVAEHLEAIKRYIKGRSDVVVISLNMNHFIDSDLIDIHVASDRSRIMLEAAQYRESQKPIALPINRLGEELTLGLEGVQILNYGLQITRNTALLHDTWCQLPSHLAAGYGLAIAVQGQCSAVSLIGFDGYTSTDHRHKEMADLLEIFLTTFPSLRIRALTPTSYSVDQGSVYEPRIT
ncbi:aldolase catalytic domain-containing protein [Alcanivorax sp. 1008]|uniref:aldolase catalytic domain-containing protein n=1 Tax=Alcanivorax sp. 1008 TaxID=2816853 RepID=UPI001DF4BB12|nr:aldolase catalytic domain-containing protein [Alcanivorax sp. 1008]MCC1495976.1 aldolase catalytic domain-containing protein [Alcanivorax sp. 1008]